MKKRRVLAIILTAMLLLSLLGCDRLVVKPANTDKQAAKAAEKLTRDDPVFLYKGVGYGMSAVDVKAKLGEPESMNDAESWCYRDGAVVYFDTEKVYCIWVPITANGIKQGDPVSKVIGIMGNGIKEASIHETDKKNPLYYTLQYTARPDRNIWFFIAEGRVNFIEIGQPVAD